MDLPPYFCTNQESAGVVEFIDGDGNVAEALAASACFADWYCFYKGRGWTWRWRSGIDPDDPSTWPPPAEEPEPEGI